MMMMMMMMMMVMEMLCTACVCVCVCARIDNDDKADPGQRTAGRTRARGTYVYVVHLPTLSVGLSSFITCPPRTHRPHARSAHIH